LVDKAVAVALDPICSACQFGKAKCCSHMQDKGSITHLHTLLRAGVSTDQYITYCI
jgi:hypothetical protein